MINQVKKLLLLGLVLGLSSLTALDVAHSQIVGGDFPVGSEVPFPWDMIEGDWTVSEDGETYYRFKVLSISENGTRRVWVEHRNSADKVLAEGSAFVKRNRRTLHARLQTQDGEKYRLRFAAYNSEDRLGCGERVFTVQLKELNYKGEVTTSRSHRIEKRRNLH